MWENYLTGGKIILPGWEITGRKIDLLGEEIILAGIKSFWQVHKWKTYFCRWENYFGRWEI